MSKKLSLLIVAALGIFSACNSSDNAPTGPSNPPFSPAAGAAGCQLVESGFGPTGSTPLHASAVVTGLEVPWDLAFLPGGDALVTERPGRLRLLRSGDTLVTSPVMTVDTVSSGEGGLLGIALDPGFASNSWFYVYYTASVNSGYVNRVQRYTLSSDHATATAGPVILDDLVWNTVHNGGRIKFGSDGYLYVSAGEGADATLSQNPASPGGKILRIASDGSIPSTNPQPGNPWFVMGLRNSEAFDFWDPNTLLIADNGPTGEYQGRTGGDKLNIAQKGSNLGWPTIWHCEAQPGLVASILSWIEAVPPGGLLVYKGNDFPQWQNNILIGATGAEHLHRVVLNADGGVATHEVYLQGTLGRLRTPLLDPSGALLVTTTNCDGRGSCPAQKDGIYKISPGN